MRRLHRSSLEQRGMTLIELMVAMVIGLVLTLAVTSVVIVGESHRRSTTSVNDREQSGAYAALVLDRALRSAGSGISQTWSAGGYACELAAKQEGKVILPRTSEWPAPFKDFPMAPRLAPVLIQQGTGDASDVIMVLTGAAAVGDVPRPIRSALPDSAMVRLDGTMQISAGDIVLVTQEGASTCLVEQVADKFVGAASVDGLSFGGAYDIDASSTVALSDMAASGSGYVSMLGNDGAGPNRPQFMLYGVDDSNVLSSYDLLRFDASDTVQAVADGVNRLYAIYGLDTNEDGKVDAWMSPGQPGYDIDTLMKSPNKLKQILAVRFALVLRSSLREKDAVTGNMITVFADVPDAKREIKLSATDVLYRYQVIDSVVPLRNALLTSAP